MGKARASTTRRWHCSLFTVLTVHAQLQHFVFWILLWARRRRAGRSADNHGDEQATEKELMQDCRSCGAGSAVSQREEAAPFNRTSHRKVIALTPHCVWERKPVRRGAWCARSPRARRQEGSGGREQRRKRETRGSEIGVHVGWNAGSCVPLAVQTRRLRTHTSPHANLNTRIGRSRAPQAFVYVYTRRRTGFGMHATSASS